LHIELVISSFVKPYLLIMNFKLRITYLILWIPFCVFAQDQSISQDSLSVLEGLAYDHLYDLKYDLALELSAQMVKEATDQQNDYFTFSGYDIIGAVYTEIKDTLQARLNFEKALQVAKKAKSDSLLSWAYLNLGNNESDQKINYQKGIDYYKKSILLNKKLGSEDRNKVPYLNIGWTYLDEEQEEKAFPFLLKAKNLIEKDSTSYTMLADIKTLLARYYLKKKDYTLAEKRLEEAAAIIQQYDLPLEGADTFKYLALLAKEKRDYKAAYEFLEQQKVYENRLNEANRRSEIQIAGAKFNLEQFEHDLEDARKEKIITDQLVEKSRQLNIIFIIASIVLLGGLIAIFLAFRLRKKLINRLRDKNRQLREAKENAERLSKLKTQFFSTVSHELRTPLYGVIGITSILLEENKAGEQQDDLKSLKFSADYLLALINDVLLLNKMDVDGIQLQDTSFKLEALMQSIIQSFAFSFEQQNNKVHLTIDKRLPLTILGDSIRLSQILMNLIGNATKFNENGNVWVNIGLIEKTVDEVYRTEFSIKDDGIGIPESKQQFIFKEFSQIESRNYNYQGTGLGLSIVRKLLALYGSEIKLKSAIGKGSTFSFVIDLKASNIEIKEAYKQPVKYTDNNVHSLKDVHILVVDDNRINQKITQKILEKRQFRCSLADNGAQAIELAMKHSYDLILMDIHMPEINGIEATKAIRKFNANIPILALTAVELDEMRVKIMSSGMNDIILKPYDVSEFLTTVLRNLHYAFSKV